jgi:transcriptional regulator with XRE-family HTH domain
LRDATTTSGPRTGELGAFLRSRRDRLTPGDVGVRSFGRRRVAGLRREELAELAGVSVTYYSRLEQGRSQNPSDSVIEALARALLLDRAERAHLLALAHARTVTRRPPTQPERLTPGARQLLHAMETVPALLLGRCHDILAWNRAGHLLLAGHLDFDAPDRSVDRPNRMRMLFLDPHTHALYRDWETETSVAVASLRRVSAQFPGDRRLTDLVVELELSSETFARLWREHTVRLCVSGTTRLHHPVLGDLTLDCEVLHLAEGHGQRILTYSAAPGSTARSVLRLMLDGV